MNKKTLAIILSIAIVIGAFAGLSFNLFSASAETYVPVGEELATTASTGWLSYWVKAANTEAQKGIYFTTFDNTGTEKHYAQFDPVPYVAGTNLPVAGATKYFAVPKKTITTNVSNPTLRERVVFMAKTTGATNANPADSTLGAGMEDGINKDKTYIISVWVKLPEATTETVKAYFSTARWSANIAGSTRSKSQEWTLTTQWQQISWAFNPDTTDTTNDNNNEVFFGLALTQASAIDFVGLSIKEAVVATPAPTEEPTPEPEYVGNGTEFVVNGDGSGNMKLKDSGTSTAGSATLTVVDDANDHGGNGKAFKSTPRSDNSTGARWYFNSCNTMITVGGEGKYVATIWVKAAQATKVAWGAEQAYGIGTRTLYDVPANTWTKVTAIIDVATVESGGTQFVLGLFVNSDSAALDIYLDDISVQKAVVATPAPEPTATPVPEGDGNELILNGNANADAAAQVSTSVGKSGGFWSKINGTSAKVPAVTYADKDGNGYAFSVGPRANNGEGLRAWFPDIQIAEGTYVFKFALKADSALDVKLVMKKGGYPEATDLLKTYSITAGDWTEYTYVLELAEDSEDGKYYMGFLTNDATSNATTFYIDAISLQAAATDEGNEEIVGNGIELVTDGNAPATAGNTVKFGDIEIKHFKTGGGTSQFNIGQDSVAGTDADGNGRYFAVAKIALIDAEASNSALRNKLPFFVQNVVFTVGQTYVASVKVKLPAAGETVTATLATANSSSQLHIAEPVKLVNKSEAVTLTTEWQEIKVVFVASADDKQFGLTLSTPAAVDIDSISIQQVGTPVDNTDKYTKNLFTEHGNGSFSNGTDIAPLYATETTKWAVDIVSTDSQDNDGKAALVSMRGVEYAAPRAKATDIIKAYGAGKYTFTAYVKSTGADVTLQPVIQMVWGEAYNTDNQAAGLTVGSWKTGTTEVINGTAWTKISVEFEIDSLTKTGAKGDALELREVLCYAKDTAFNALFAPDLLVDNLSLVKEINGQENADLIAQLGGGAANGGGSSAGSSSTGDVVPVALIAVTLVSAAALVVVARRKRED